LVVCASKVYSGIGADIVYGIITLIDLSRAMMSEIARLQQLIGQRGDAVNFGG
jgi:hypothetical protein